MTAGLHWLGTANGLVALAVGVITLAFLLAKGAARINQAMRRQQAIDDLLQRELVDDGNGSLKGAVKHMNEQLGHQHEQLVQAKVDVGKIQTTLDRHIFDARMHVQLHDHDPDAHRRDDGTPDDGVAGPR